MNSAEAIVIMQTLLSCRTLFSDFFPIPNYVTLTAFEYAPSEGITVQEWTNGTQGSKKKIKFNATGLPFDKIQIQMVERDGKMVLGGQISETKGQRKPFNCAVFGDAKELRLLFPGDKCVTKCFYRTKDLIYQIESKAGEACKVYDIEGKDVRWFFSPSEFDCSSPFGLVPDEDLFVYRKNGECKQADFSVLDKSYTPQSCPRREIELGPNKLSEYYHLRYLLSISECAENVTDIGDPDNIYVRFMHKNETLIEPTEPPSTTVVVVTEERNIQEYLAYGLFSVVGFVVLVLVILGVIYRKKLLNKCRGKKEPAPPVKPTPVAPTPLPPPPAPPAPVSSRREVVSEATTQEVTEQEMVPQKDIAEDSMGNVDENLKSVNPLDMLLELEFKPGETFEDEQANWTLPTIVNCIQPYKYCEFLGAGGFGRVYKYAVLSKYESYVAIKFVKTDADEKELKWAKQEFMLIRQIQRMFKAEDDYYLLRVVDAGKYPGFIFIVTPVYYRSMGFFMPFSEGYEKATIADILTVAWNYLKGIQQLHSVGYGHNDIKPENFMQKDQGSNTIVLCDFGMVKKFGSKRQAGGMGTPAFMAITTHKGIPTSNVDDHQSWLFLSTIMLTRSAPWTPDPELGTVESDDALHDVFKKKIDFFRKLQVQAKGKPIPDRALIGALRHAIITGHGPDVPVDPKQVVKIMEEAQTTFDFKFATHEWWNYDKKSDKKKAKPRA